MQQLQRRWQTVSAEIEEHLKKLKLHVDSVQALSNYLGSNTQENWATFANTIVALAKVHRSLFGEVFTSQKGGMMGYACR